MNEPQTEDTNRIDMPSHPLKAWGEAHRRESNDTVCSHCGDDMREYEGEYVCPGCKTRGDPDRYPRRQFMDIEELMEEEA